MRTICLIVVTTLGAAAAATAQDLQVTIAPPFFPVVSDSAAITVTIRNPSPTARFDVSAVTVTLHRDLAGEARDTSYPCNMSTGTNAFDLNDVPKQCTATISGVGVGAIWRFLAFRAREYPITARLEYRAAATSDGLGSGSRERQIQEATVTVTPQAPFLVVVFGAWCGVVFVIGFRRLWARQQGTRLRTTSPVHIELLLGWVVVTVVAIGVRVAAEPVKALGLSFDVKDIVGGVIMGLAFQPIAKTIGQYFDQNSLSTKVKASSEPTASPASSDVVAGV